MLDRAGHAKFYAVMVEEDREQAAERRLKKYQFVTFLPMIHVQVRVSALRSRPVHMDRRPALPGYVFVCMPDGGDWQALRRIPNVQGIVGIGDRPYPLAYSLLCDFWERAQANAFERTPLRKRAFDCGDSVRICAGPYEGQESTVETVNGKTARMYLYLFNQPVLSTIRVDSLAAIS